MSGIAALIVAAGRGVRAGQAEPKQYRLLAGRPVLRRTLDVFARHPRIDRIQVVIGDGDRAAYDIAVAGLDLAPACLGGATRRASVAAGLEALSTEPPARVLIHDAARPFVTGALIDRVIDALETADGAAPALAVSDTLLRARDGGLAGESVPRQGIVRMQTPQGFRYEAIRAAHAACRDDSQTDDVGVARAAGLEVVLVPGEEDNIKLTTPEDFDRAARRLAAAEYRTGSGFDVHAFAPGDAVTLCGVRIPHDHALAGHSDADAGLHALTDALLGAIGAGDIGQHFPPDDPQWKGADSSRFLAHARDLVTAAGGRIVNADVTLICEAPKLGPHRAAMQARIAEILGIDAGRIGVKATTTERLGFTGRGEGIAAQAIATVALPAEG
jgi:2-C-methyl-D-erythritol 4-phosphate cytidylyltransferase/2-C-methyl-D-erythritol 2,4-cyclodiphosphate synthase